MKKKLLNYLPYMLIIMIIAFAWIIKDAQNDLYFDLRTGKDLLKYGLDFKDHFCFIKDLPYLYHHYLYDLIIYGIFKLFSYSGLFIMYLLIYTLFGFIVFFVTNKFINNKVISLINSIMTISLMNVFFQTRVQSFTYPLFYLEIYYFDKLYKEGKIKYIVILCLISLLIVNLHMPVWILCIILALPFIAEMLVTKIPDAVIYVPFKIEKPKSYKLIIIAFILIILTGLISPFKLSPYTFFLKVLNNTSYELVGEMQKTKISGDLRLIIVFILATITLIKARKNMRLRNILYILGLGVLGLMAARHISYFLLVVPTISFITLFKDSKIKRPSFMEGINMTAVSILLILLFSGTYIVFINSMKISKFDYFEKEGYPKDAVKYIKDNLDYKNIKLYNGLNFGSYLAYNDIPVFIDSRLEVYMKKFNKKEDIIGDYMNVRNYDNYKALFKKYDFDYALVYKKTGMSEYLTKDEYEIIYEDDAYELYKIK